MPIFKTLIASLLIGVTTASFTAPAAKAFDAGNKAELGQFIHDYLVAHPEVLLDAQNALQAKQQAAQQARAKNAIARNKQAIFQNPGDLVLGNPDGDVSIVEFFDYNCVYCKHAVSDMKALVASDGNVRYVMKEFPILGPDSVAASRVSMAFEMIAPKKFKQFHEQLLSGSAHASAARAFAIAAGLGVDKAAVKAKMDDPAIEARIKQSYALADQLNITGTPAYVVGDDAFSGAVGAKALEQKVNNVRDCNSTTC